MMYTGKMLTRLKGIALIALVAAGATMSPAQAQGTNLEAAFDNALGTELREPRTFEAVYESGFERRIAQLADGTRGRIGVYAIDLSSGDEVSVLGDQFFPMASTSKVAVAATYLAGVDEGRWGLTSEWQLPRQGGAHVPAYRLIELMISKSCNDCTDALLDAVGGPAAVNAWVKKAGISGFNLNRNIRALIRDDGEVDPASVVDTRDAATPRAMGQLLAGIYQGRWLSSSSRQVILDSMEQTTTGKRRMRSAVPLSAKLAHKTGTLSRTASDIGIFHTPDGRPIAVAIYVTGQSPSMAVENGSRSAKLDARSQRDMRIATIAGALYEGFGGRNSDGRVWTSSGYGGE